MMQTLVQINSGIRYEDVLVRGTDRVRRVERYPVLEGRLAESEAETETETDQMRP